MSSAVKYNKFSDDMYTEMYNQHATASLEDFKKWGINVIQNNTVSSNLKKSEFIAMIRACATKDRLVVKLNSVFMAGENLKVYEPRRKAA